MAALTMPGHEQRPEYCVSRSSRKHSMKPGDAQEALRSPCIDSLARLGAHQLHKQSLEHDGVGGLASSKPKLLGRIGDCSSGDSDGSHQFRLHNSNHSSPSLDKAEASSGSVLQPAGVGVALSLGTVVGGDARQCHDTSAPAEGSQQQRKPVEVLSFQQSNKSGCTSLLEVAATTTADCREAAAALEAAAAADHGIVASPTPATPSRPSCTPPLPPPSPSASDSIQAEYQQYLQRFQAGHTLAQRWQRLKDNGLWEGLKEEWEEWQNELLLQQLQASNAEQRAGRGKARGRRELDPADMDDVGGRRTRARRVPATLQDYQVDTPVSVSPAPGATHDDLTASECRTHTATGTEDNGRSFVGRDMQPKKRSRREPAPRIVEHRVYHPEQLLSSHDVQAADSMGWHSYLQQQGCTQSGRLQQQQAMQHTAHHQQACPDALMQQLYHLGTQLGSALQHGGAATGNAGLPDGSSPAGLAAAMEAVCMRMFNGDASAMMQHLAAAVQR